MDLYTYVAGSNPYQAKSLLHKYGYSATNVKDTKDLGVCLKKLVVNEGEKAFQDVLNCHPDKGVILEVFQKDAPKQVEHKNCSGDCSCNRKREQYMNATGDSDVKSASNAQQTSVFILAAALLLAAAIIVKN
jgi:hypothetical protein